MITAKIILLFSLVAIVYQDLKQRAISWLFLPVIFLSLSYIRYKQEDPVFLIKYTMINVLIVTGIFLLTYLYFVIRRRVNLKGFFNDQIGIGDVLFFLSLTPYFAPMSFLFFLLASQFFILIGYLLYAIRAKGEKTIPLAGLVSVCMAAMILFNQFFPKINVMLNGYFNL